MFQQRQQFVCLFFLSIFILVLSGGCRNKNHAPTSGNGLPTPKAPTSVQKALDLLQAQTLNPDWFSAKAHITANGSQFNQSFNADIRLRTDSALWVSITAPIIGIEVVRALITPDSARVLDRFNKNYHVYPLTELRHFTRLRPSICRFSECFTWQPANNAPSCKYRPSKNRYLNLVKQQ
ncbi:MAG: DUF4292 domain-containing protein [Sphingobacteriales bacterium]|nr:DUF4292 domain-containing protein [Sphingobacteriales bacterium]